MQVVWESLHSTLLVILLLCLIQREGKGSGGRRARGVGRQYVRRHARARHALPRPWAPPRSRRPLFRWQMR